MKYAIYLTSGVYPDTAKPVRGLLEVSDLPAADFATRLADQVALLNAGEATIQVEDTAVLTDLDSDANTYDYTVDITDPVPVALTPVSTARFSLSQKQGFVKERRDFLIAEAVRASHFDRFISDTDLSTFATYISALRSISDSEASPDTVVFPTLGAIAGAADRVLTRQYRRGNIVDGVGLSSGVPTGGIIETATNVNGLYIRTADGGQFCKARLKAEYFSVATMAVAWTFPAAFIDLASPVTIPVMSLKNLSNVDDGLSANDIRQCQIIESNRAATSVTFQIKSPTLSFSAGDEIWVSMLAMGRWAV